MFLQLINDIKLDIKNVYLRLGKNLPFLNPESVNLNGLLRPMWLP